MKTIIELITDEIKNVFTECGYDEAYAKVTVSNRPDLCEFQCNGAMAAAKAYKKAPFMIADEVVAKLTDNKMFSKIESVKPGFININICEDYLAGYLNEMSETEKFGYFNADNTYKISKDAIGKHIDLGSGKSESIYESDNDTGYFYITFDGNYIWMDDEGYKNMAMYFNKQSSSLDYTLYQLDRDGKLAAKRTIPDEEKIFSIMHGDSSRMFMFSFVNNKIVYIDKSNIEKGDIKELR